MTARDGGTSAWWRHEHSITRALAAAQYHSAGTSDGPLSNNAPRLPGHSNCLTRKTWGGLRPGPLSERPRTTDTHREVDFWLVPALLACVARVCGEGRSSGPLLCLPHRRGAEEEEDEDRGEDEETACDKIQQPRWYGTRSRCRWCCS